MTVWCSTAATTAPTGQLPKDGIIIKARVRHQQLAPPSAARSCFKALPPPHASPSGSLVPPFSRLHQSGSGRPVTSCALTRCCTSAWRCTPPPRDCSFCSALLPSLQVSYLFSAFLFSPLHPASQRLPPPSQSPSEILNSPWFGLPELQNLNGAFCRCAICSFFEEHFASPVHHVAAIAHLAFAFMMRLLLQR